jgi:hypothetical protein
MLNQHIQRPHRQRIEGALARCKSLGEGFYRLDIVALDASYDAALSVLSWSYLLDVWKNGNLHDIFIYVYMNTVA